MTTKEFNEKYKSYLADGHYGMIIHDEDVIDYLNKRFEELISDGYLLEYMQIKTKFGIPQVYTNLPREIEAEMEHELYKILSKNHK